MAADMHDNLPTNGKRYYMSHCEYIHCEDHVLYKMYGDAIQKLSQLVCASNMENAQIAISNSLGQNIIILKNRIDYLIVGD